MTTPTIVKLWVVQVRWDGTVESRLIEYVKKNQRYDALQGTNNEPLAPIGLRRISEVPKLGGLFNPCAVGHTKEEAFATLRAELTKRVKKAQEDIDTYTKLIKAVDES